MLIDRDEMEIMVYPGLFPSIWPIWDLEALLRNLRGADPRAQASSTCLWICHNYWIIYAHSWTQLFPMSTVVKKRWDADSLKTDWMLLLVFICGACHQSCGLEMDVVLPPWWERPAELCELTPHGRCHLPIPSCLIWPFLYFPPFYVLFLSSYWELTVGCPHPLLFLSQSHRFIFPLLHHPFLSSFHIPLSFSVLHSRANRQLCWPLCFPFDWPNSLFTSPRHKRHQADWSAGRSQGTADQWGLGQGRGGGVNGGRWGGGEREKGWTGRLTDAQSAGQSMGTFAELR